MVLNKERVTLNSYSFLIFVNLKNNNNEKKIFFKYDLIISQEVYMLITKQPINFKSNNDSPNEYMEKKVYQLRQEVSDDVFIGNAHKKRFNSALIKLLRLSTIEKFLDMATESYQKKLSEKKEQLEKAQAEFDYFNTNKNKLITKEYKLIVDHKLELIKEDVYRYN